MAASNSAVTATSESPQDQYRHYFVSGANLHPRLLALRFAGVKPIATYTVSVRDAYLSFDFNGVPFLEPAYSSCILPGVNDEFEGVTRDSEEWKREIWGRCCPGLEFSGHLPPILEGVVYKFTTESFDQLISNQSTTYRLVEVDCDIFETGDGDIIVGSVRATTSIPYAENTAAGLRPTARYLRLAILGSFFSLLSQPFLGHLMLLRPLEPPKTMSGRLQSLLYRCLLLPPFILFYLPSYFLRRAGIKSSGNKRRWLGGCIWNVCDAFRMMGRSGRSIEKSKQEDIVDKSKDD